MLARCQLRYRAGIKVVSGWTSDDFITGELQTVTAGGNKRHAEIRISRGAPVVLWALYNVQVVYIGSDQILMSGVESIETSRGTRWVYQLLKCERSTESSNTAPTPGARVIVKPEESAWRRATSTPRV